MYTHYHEHILSHFLNITLEDSINYHRSVYRHILYKLCCKIASLERASSNGFNECISPKCRKIHSLN